MAFNTGNPLGSTDPRDFSDNSENLDKAVNDTANPTFLDRFGNTRVTLANQLGYNLKGDYAAGIVLVSYSDIIRYNSEFYRPSASAALPYTTTATLPDADSNLVPVGDANLRQELALSPSTGQGAALVNGATIYVGSVAELEALSLAAGTNVYLTEDGKAGEGVIKSGAHPTDTYKGRFIDLANGNYWDRIIEDGTVYLSWFAPDVTGVTESEAVIQSAVNLTPENYILSYEGLEGTILIDVPAGQLTARPRGVYFDKPMTVKGSPNLITKIKDFSSAWLTYTGTISAYQSEASDVIIDGLVVDANADNHYETDVGGVKWWEDGPELKRPPNGITVFCAESAPEITGNRVRNCTVMRPLAGIQAIGDLANLQDPTFIDGSITNSIVRDVVFEDNNVYRARGNDFLFSSGVRESSVRNNYSQDCYYHTVRFYVSVIDCEMINNRAYIDHTRMLALYNATDNGYWRTDDTGSVSYLMSRSGFCVGSIFSTGADTAYNRTKGNSIWYKRTNDSYTICDGASLSYAGVVIRDEISYCLAEGNRIDNAPIFAISLSLSPPDLTLQGIVVKNNTVNKSFRTALISRGYDALILENSFNNCAQAAGYPVCEVSQGRAFYNRVTASAPLVNYAFSTGDNPTGTIWISDNYINNYTLGTLENTTNYDVHGTEGGGIDLVLINGWVNGFAGTPASSNICKVIKSANGFVKLIGNLNGSASTADKIADLPATYYPGEQTYSVGVQYASIGGTVEGAVYVIRAARDGQLFVQRNGQDAARCFINATWYSEKPVLPDPV